MAVLVTWLIIGIICTGSYFVFTWFFNQECTFGESIFSWKVAILLTIIWPVYIYYIINCFERKEIIYNIKEYFKR